MAFTEDGLWYSPFWEGPGYQAAFKTKKELVKDIAAAHMDARATPLVKRAGAHRYVYRVKDCDTGQYGESFSLYQVLPENIAWLESLLEAYEDEATPFS